MLRLCLTTSSTACARYINPTVEGQNIIFAENKMQIRNLRPKMDQNRYISSLDRAGT